MDQIILDSYFLVGLHLERFKEITVYKLQELLFLSQAKSLCELNDEEGLYPKSFTLDLMRSM